MEELAGHQQEAERHLRSAQDQQHEMGTGERQRLGDQRCYRRSADDLEGPEPDEQQPEHYPQGRKREGSQRLDSRAVQGPSPCDDHPQLGDNSLRQARPDPPGPLPKDKATKRN